MCCVQWFLSLKAEASNWCTVIPSPNIEHTHRKSGWVMDLMFWGSLLQESRWIGGSDDPHGQEQRAVARPLLDRALEKATDWREICNKPRSRSIARRKRIALLQRHRNGRGPRVRSCYSPLSWDKTMIQSLCFVSIGFNAYVCVQGLNENIESK